MIYDEIWAQIDGFPKHWISSRGRVYSFEKNKFIGRMATHGYMIVGIYGKVYYIHRLVAQTFLSNENNFPIVNHKDENKSNNNAENLEWCTQLYNTNYGNSIRKMRENRPKTKVIYTKDGVDIEYESMTEAAKATGHSRESIYVMCKKPYMLKGYDFTFRYANKPPKPIVSTLIGKPVKMFKDGYEKTYESITYAADKNHCSKNTIKKHIKNKKPDKNGFYWELLEKT